MAKLSKGIIVSKKGGEMTAQDCLDEIMDKELFDFWLTGMEDAGYPLIMEDGAPYHQSVATLRRMQLEDNRWIGWGPKYGLQVFQI